VTPSEAFVSQGLFFAGVKLGALAGETGLGYAGHDIRQRGLNGLAAIGEAARRHEVIDSLQKVGVDRHGDFGLRHGDLWSMIHHHTLNGLTPRCTRPALVVS
jgi:hypothetical protein